jgi:L-alanine-DL-glutamate epimerase-like enolase superfamily enzyme
MRDVRGHETMAEGRELAPMRITRIRAAALCGESPKGGWSNEIKPEESIHAIIAVHTDSGMTGFGSTFTSGALARAALEVLEPLIIGENALEPARLCEKLHQNTFWLGRGGTLTHVISGIDIALWDLLGRATGLSVARLLAGRHKNRVQPYCSLLMDEPERMRDIISPFREKGFRAFKIGWGPFGRRDDTQHDEAIIRAAREAVGHDNKLLVDAGASDAYWPEGLKWALRTADMLADYDVAWFEEALKPDDIEGHLSLRQASRVPIAGGETLTRRQSFTPWIVRGALDIVQPDVTKVGGLSEQRRIAWLAQDFGVKYVGHGWNTAFGLAADLQMAAAFPDATLVEYIGGSAYVDDLTHESFVLDSEGYLTIPDRPGLGITLDRDKIARYAPDAASLFQTA